MTQPVKNLSIIVAVAEANAIGYKNDLLCHIPGDLKRFKDITSGHTVIMGKRTYFSLPKRPLPNRINIVISDDRNDNFEGCLMAYSIEEAIAKCNPADESFVIGGGMIYKQFFPIASKLYITHVYKKFEADTFFPAISPAEWKVVAREDFQAGPQNDFAFAYVTYERI
jgi:dihydrofolate reductase